MAIGGDRGLMNVYNNYDRSITLQNLTSFQAHTDGIPRIIQSPFSNDLVATCALDFTVKVWNISSISNWTLSLNYTSHSKYVWALEWIDKETIASGSSDETIQIWSVASGQKQRTINTFHSVFSLKLLSNGFYLAVGLFVSNIRIYNINDGSLVKILQGHTDQVNGLTLINNSTLASSSSDKTIRIWDLNTYDEKFNLAGHTSAIFGLKLLSSSLLASASIDTTIKLWNTTNGIEIRTLTGHKETVFAIDLLNQNERTLISGSWDKTIKVWDWSTGQCLNTIETDLVIWSLAKINN